jgi:hypothetical protein
MNRFTREFRSAALAWAAAATIQSNVVHNTIAIQIELNSTLRFRAPREVFFHVHVSQAPIATDTGQSLMVWGKEIFE